MATNKKNDITKKAEKLFYSNQYGGKGKTDASMSQTFSENIGAQVYNGLLKMLRSLGAEMYDSIEETIGELITEETTYRSAVTKKRFFAALRNEDVDVVGKSCLTGNERVLGWGSISYQVLYSIMAEYDITYLQLMDACGIVDFPKFNNLPADVQSVYLLVDKLPETARRGFVKESALSLTDTFWQEQYWDDETKALLARPSSRAMLLFKRRCSYKRGELLNADKLIQSNPSEFDEESAKRIHEMAKLLSMRFARGTIDESVAANVAAALQTSIHWLMGMPDNILVYAEHGDTEKIVDAYYFMSKKNRKIFLSALEKFSEQVQKLNSQISEEERK